MGARRQVALALLLVAGGCGSDDPPAPEPLPPRDPPPEAGPFEAGFAEAKLPVPLGIGTMGYGGIGLEIPESVTPFAVEYPGTTRAHAALTVKVVALSRGPAHELIFVRTDTVGIFQHLREAVLDELEARTGRDWDDALIIGANHTHSGPGRLLQVEGLLKLLADEFFPELYDRMVDGLADAIEAAVDDLGPAELGWTMAHNSEAHNDRRCENDALEQVQERPDLPIVAIRRDGTLEALVMSYAYHGTILDIDHLTLSGDMGGAAEQKIAERFDHPVSVLLFNSWGGDMSPGDPAIDDGATGADQPDGYDRMQGLGVRLADTVAPAVETIDNFTSEPALRGQTYRVLINRDVLGYADDEFWYVNGGVYCGVDSGNCDDATPVEGLDMGCLAFTAAEPAPDRTVFTAGWIDDLYLVTGGGEWVTGLATGVTDRIAELTGGQVMFVGYANDYTGYNTPAADWWQGGYETGGALWGPRQGDHYAAALYEAFRHVYDLSYYLSFTEPEPVEPFAGYTYEPYEAESALNVGELAQDVPAAVGATDVVTFTVLGTDPWLGVPVATLEQESSGSFEPVTRLNGTEVNSGSYDFWVDLAVEPSYASDLDAAERSFQWTFHFPVTRRADSSIPELSGTYRFQVRIPTDGAGSTAVVETSVFAIQ